MFFFILFFLNERVPNVCLFVQDESAASVDAGHGSLRRLLEQELALDSRDLRSHAWYHGSIPRHRAEEIVAKDGDFLVRDCASQPGNFVLTCRSKGLPLHFVINKVYLNPSATSWLM